MTNEEMAEFVRQSEAAYAATIRAHEVQREGRLDAQRVAQEEISRAQDGILQSDLLAGKTQRQVFNSGERSGGGGSVIPLLLIAAAIVVLIVWRLL